MSNSLSDILQNRDFDEPAESVRIKKYIASKYDKSIEVKVSDKDIIISAQGAAFVNTLRMQWKQIQQAADTDKKLVFRIA